MVQTINNGNHTSHFNILKHIYLRFFKFDKDYLLNKCLTKSIKLFSYSQIFLERNKKVILVSKLKYLITNHKNLALLHLTHFNKRNKIKT